MASAKLFSRESGCFAPANEEYADNPRWFARLTQFVVAAL
jgi:hypothetical protein